MFVNFLQGLRYKSINSKRKFRENGSYGKQKKVHWCSVTSLLLKPLILPVIYVTQFRLTKSLYSRSVPFKRTNNFGCFSTSFVSQNLRDQIQDTSELSFLHILFVVTLYLVLLFVTVAMLSRYQSPVNFRSRHLEGNLTKK